MTIDVTSADLTTTESIRTESAEALRGLCGGHVYLLGDPGYDEFRTPWNLAEQRPAAVAVPGPPLKSPRSSGPRPRPAFGSPASTGHNSAPLAARGMADVVLVRTSALTEVSVDRATLTARVGGGVEWEAAVNAAAAEGLSTLHGSSPNVGIAGYSLGGGTGWYARKLGLAANHLTAVEIVIADGTLVRADADHHAELFWAARRRRQLRCGDRTRVRCVRLQYRVRRHDDLGRRPGPRGPAALGSVVDRRSRRGDHVVPAAELPPLPELPDFLRGRPW